MIRFLFFFSLFLASCSSSKLAENNYRYFDVNNEEISQSEFEEFRATNRFLDISGDSTHHKKLTERERWGTINDRKSLEVYLEKATGRELDSEKPIVIVYYPGKDPCNSSGSSNKERIQNWFGQLEEGLKQVADIEPIYLYKSKEGLEKYDGILTWVDDPEGAIERLFFPYHYPCMSFVVISKQGDFASYFGEFGQSIVWKKTQQIMNY